MNQTDLQILLQLKDEASAEFKKAGESMTKTAKSTSDSFKLTGNSMASLQKIVVGGAAAAGAALTAFLYSSAKAAADAQVQMARVDATLESMGEAALKNKDAILKAADAAVKLGFDDEDAAESITKLYQRTKDLTQAQQLNALAMDLARAKNIELSEATNLVGMVLSGNGRMLKQYGIEISESLPPLEALKALQKQVAGQADAFSNTFQGQMEVISISFQNIKETIGSALIDALMPFIQQFTAWLNDPKTKESFAKWTADFQSWAEVIIPVVIDVFKLWASVLKGIYDVLLKIGESIMSVVDKAKSLGSTLKDAYKNAGSNIKWAVGLEGRASGGPVSANTPYMVGERGPELFIPNNSGSIVPNGSMGGMGNISVSLNGNFYGTDQGTAEKFADMIAEMIGQNMKLRTI